MTDDTGLEVRWRDRCGAWLIGHPWWAALAVSAAFYVLLSVPTAAFYGSVGATVLVPGALLYGGLLVSWVRTGALAQSGADAVQIARARIAIKAARAGRTVVVPDEIRALLLRQCRRELRVLRWLPGLAVVLGVVLAVPAVLIAASGERLLGGLILGVAVVSAALVWWAGAHGRRTVQRILSALQPPDTPPPPDTQTIDN
ncbi:hypothetical protein [Pseudonocardia sp. ICBG601]|uniref:hypothetical protein n=1 Tax=Pseudonocardia sp. ICBG601 TaxID=2846759 RepID=UPI001CF68156|nr:hypothetical protein [Pseudonocardia sp. ICBG601]